jgi:hypothetical protein
MKVGAGAFCTLQLLAPPATAVAIFTFQGAFHFVVVHGRSCTLQMLKGMLLNSKGECHACGS